MDVHDQDLSLLFFNYLCKVVGSEDVVRTRRRIFNAVDYVSREKKITFISCGSKAEGLDLSGSDLDLMVVFNDSVYENIDDINYVPQRKSIISSLLMDTKDTQPGYTRLKFVFINHTHSNNDYNTFLSNKMLLERFFTIDGYIIHGPCRSDPRGFIDNVLGYHCKKWISQADEWTHRLRSSWPHNRLIDTIVQYGVLFVPIGCKNSPGEEFEFRISFNVAEKILVHSFCHVQLLCYALLKICLNNLIKPQYGELLCSYFLKTIMFWLSEETEESTWKPKNLLRCFDRCFKRLVYCVTYSTCLHYFIPELNFFEDRFSKSEHEALTSTLQRLYSSGWQFVLQTNELSSFVYCIGPSPTRTVPSVSALPSIIRTAGELRNVYRAVFGALNLPGKAIYAFILSRMNQTLAQIIPIDTYNSTNKHKYRNYRKCLSHLMQGLHHDAVSGWLFLASFFYRFHQYHQCLNILNYCVFKCTPDKIIPFINIDTKIQHEFNIEMQKHTKNRFTRSCKRRVINFVSFHKESYIIPEEFSALFEEQTIMLSPIVYAHFLHCICLHRLNRNRGKIQALRDLATTVQELCFMYPNYNQIDLSYKCLASARKLFQKFT